jgi:hypothetical protein
MSAEGVASPGGPSVSLPTLAELRARVYAPLRDSERSFVEPWYVDLLLNEAYIDLNARLRIKKLVVSGTASATGTVTVPSDFVELESLWIGSTPVNIVDDATFLSFSESGVSPYASSQVSAILGRANGSTFETFPVQVSQAYTLEYVARPAELVGELDQPVELSLELVPRIVNYARAYAKWQEGESQEGDKYMALYEQGLPGSPRDTFKRRPFPMTLIPEPGPFG